MKPRHRLALLVFASFAVVAIGCAASDDESDGSADSNISASKPGAGVAVPGAGADDPYAGLGGGTGVGPYGPIGPYGPTGPYQVGSGSGSQMPRFEGPQD